MSHIWFSWFSWVGLNFSYEEKAIAILDKQVEVEDKWHTFSEGLVKARPFEEPTWELESDIPVRYPNLFEASGTLIFFIFKDEQFFYW